MQKLEGVVVSTKMQNTIIVEVTRKVAHPIYRKLLKRSKKYKVSPEDFKVEVGNVVRIMQTKPISKEKYFKVIEVVNIHDRKRKVK